MEGFMSADVTTTHRTFWTEDNIIRFFLTEDSIGY